MLLLYHILRITASSIKLWQPLYRDREAERAEEQHDQDRTGAADSEKVNTDIVTPSGLHFGEILCGSEGGFVFGDLESGASVSPLKLYQDNRSII